MYRLSKFLFVEIDLSARDGLIGEYGKPDLRRKRFLKSKTRFDKWNGWAMELIAIWTKVPDPKLNLMGLRYFYSQRKSTIMIADKSLADTLGSIMKKA